MELREAIARAISRRHGYGEFITTLEDADVAIAEILKDHAIVPKEPTEAMNETERQIVAWLREQEAEWETKIHRDCADAIERGEHRGTASDK